MNIVGIRTDNGKVFESCPVNEEIESAAEEAENAVKSDAENANIGVSTEQMTGDELSAYIASHWC